MKNQSEQFVTALIEYIWAVKEDPDSINTHLLEKQLYELIGSKHPSYKERNEIQN